MKTVINFIFLALMLCSMNAAVASSISEKTPEDAIKRYGLNKLTEFAESGDAKAIHFLAVLYLDGKHVPKNFRLAEQWLLRGANLGSPSTQFVLGFIEMDKLKGDNMLIMPEAAVRAYVWFSLAASQGHKRALQERDRMGFVLGDEVNIAQDVATNWRGCNSKNCWNQQPVISNAENCKNNPTSIFCRK